MHQLLVEIHDKALEKESKINTETLLQWADQGEDFDEWTVRVFDNMIEFIDEGDKRTIYRQYISRDDWIRLLSLAEEVPDWKDVQN